MIDVSSKLFYCYAWEDIAKIKNILIELEDELKAKLSSELDTKYSSDLNDNTYKNIEDAEIFVVFISEASKKSDYAKACVTRALNLNKNILPIEIEKLSLFSSMPDEFKFRSKPYSFVDKTSKSMLFAQLKASLGFNVESGDGFGALIHVVTDRDARVYRYGEDLGLAKSGEDHKIRLKKGTHLLEFVDTIDSTIKYSMSYDVQSNDNEQFLNVPLNKLLREKQLEEEKALREVEMRKKFEEEQFQKNLELEQRQRELEVQRQQQEVQRKQQELQKQQQRIEQERIAATTQNNDDNWGCGWIWWIIGIIWLCGMGISML